MNDNVSFKNVSFESFSMIVPVIHEVIPKISFRCYMSKWGCYIIPPTTVEEKAQKRLEVKAKSTFMMGIPNEHQLKFNSIKDAKLLLEAIEKSSETLDQTFDRLQKLVSQLEILGETLSQEDMNQNLLRSLSPEWNTHAVMWRNKPKLETMSMDDLYNNLKVYEPEVKGISSSNTSTQNMAFVSSNNSGSTNEAVNTAHGVSAASTQANAANPINVDNLSDAVISAFFSRQPNNPQLANKDLQQLYPDDLEEMDLRWQMAIATTATIGDTLLGSAELQETKTTRTRKAQEGAKEGPNYTLMAYSSSSSYSEVSNDSTCSKSCLETVEVLKSQYEQLLKRFEKFELMVVAYKTGLHLEEFTNEPVVIKPVVENSEAKASEAKPKAVRKNNGAPIIEDWVSDSEEENVSQTKIEKKTAKPSFVKIDFVKAKQTNKTDRKTAKQVEHNRQNTHIPRGNQRN
ncbi:hypothetical protein Tco_1234408 [Tanacetum coccineum]